MIAKTLILLCFTATAALNTRENVRRLRDRPLGFVNHISKRVRQNTPLEAASLAQPAPRVPDFMLDRGGEKRTGKSFLERHPLASAVGITTVNAVAADLLTQLVFEAGPWNPKRSLVFAAFGFVYQGMAQYFIVNFGWERLFPGNSRSAVVSKICGMNLLSDPLLFMPCFYIFKEVLAQGSLTMATVKAALWAYKGNCPGHAVTYGVMPAHKRIPWMAFLSFFYMCILSLTRG
eukprot:CAMPEP_0117042524 /NCGR_PEP_ID=MMETSP0472-20121206/29611_1 /TAXON_ID=693140 ORGANISM="Tiarina fusus, Strain LIS" /NCGR_SAMPLE_ID=MMETSP0472 /ASSEMBLY_ACC=CAM_ASM_000603 /LENGTH=232 /DNA_ID=CAMNT_0004753793 /DNA_START=95 /DNA_END=793 /DNA_ORIENTATION=-